MLIKTRFRIPDVFLGMLLAVAIFAVGSLFENHEPNKRAINQSAEPQSQQPTVPVRYWHILGIDFLPADFLAALLVGATLFAGTVAIYGIYNQRREMKITQRAFLSVEPGGTREFEGFEDQRVACDIIIHNTGNLTAQKIKWGMGTCFSDDPEKKCFGFDTLKLDGNIVIGAKIKARKGSEPVLKADFEVWRSEARPNRAWLYVFGRIQYHDGFCPTRRIDFCHRYNLRGTHGYNLRAEDGRYHEHGNHTDEG